MESGAQRGVMAYRITHWFQVILETDSSFVLLLSLIDESSPTCCTQITGGLFRCRFWPRGSGVGPETLHSWQIPRCRAHAGSQALAHFPPNWFDLMYLHNVKDPSAHHSDSELIRLCIGNNAVCQDFWNIYHLSVRLSICLGNRDVINE